MKHLGDYDASAVIYDKFTTFRPSTGAAFTLGGTPALSVYKDNSTTQSTTGVTLTADFDSVTGLNHYAIDTSADGTFYSAGSFFQVVITTGTVDSVSVVGSVVSSFTIRKDSSLKPATAGRTLVVDAAGLADANTVKLGPSGSGTAQTARDMGAAVPAATPGAAGGLLIAGSNAPTTFAGSGSSAGLTITGGGTALGALVLTGGSTSGAALYANTTNGPGAQITGTGSNAGLLLTGGSSAYGLDITGTGGGMSINGVSGIGLAISGSTNGVDVAGGTYGMIIDGGTTGVGLQLNGGTGLAGLNVRRVVVTGGAGAGDALTITGGGVSGNGVTITTTSGHGISIAPVGTSKHGVTIAGGNGGTSNGLNIAAGTGGKGVQIDTYNASGNVSISGTTTLTGAVSLGSTLAVTGTTTLTGAVSLGSTLGVTGNITLSGTLGVGATTLSSLTVTNAFAVGGATTLTGAVTATNGSNAISGVSLTAAAYEAAADALLGRNVAGGSSTGRLVKEALYFLRNKWTVSAGTLTVYQTDDTTSSWTATVAGTAGADPITSTDPA